MLRFVGRWLLRVAVAVGVGFVLLYVGDLCVFKLRGSPQSKVTVNRYVAIPLKGNKTEFDYQGTLDVTCAEAVFSQGALSPCWKLKKNPNQGITM